MTLTETELRQQESERFSLAGTVSGLQAALMFAKADSRHVLETALRNATSRLAAVENKVKDLEVKRDAEVKEASTRAVALAAQETRLSAQERETFAGFLKKDYFTKADFGKMDEFYKKSWDRLSESGKDEMSRRVWAGIRRGEFHFEDLPASVREKEAGHLHQQLKAGVDTSTEQGREFDRHAFVQAMDRHMNATAEAILNRAVTAAPAVPPADVAAMLAKTAESGERSKAEAKQKSPDLSDINLDGVQLADATATQKTTEIPNGKSVGSTKGRVSPGS